jgi:hypothetical protein
VRRFIDGMEELALGFHAANNLVGALLVTSDWSSFKHIRYLRTYLNPKQVFDVILPVMIIYPILLFIFNKKYQWTDWKEN